MFVGVGLESRGRGRKGRPSRPDAKQRCNSSFRPQADQSACEAHLIPRADRGRFAMKGERMPRLQGAKIRRSAAKPPHVPSRRSKSFGACGQGMRQSIRFVRPFESMNPCAPHYENNFPREAKENRIRGVAGRKAKSKQGRPNATPSWTFPPLSARSGPRALMKTARRVIRKRG